MRNDPATSVVMRFDGHRPEGQRGVPLYGRA